MFKETLTDPAQKLRAFMNTDCTMHLKIWYDDGNNMNGIEGIHEFRLTYNLLDDGKGIMWRKKKAAGGETEEIFAHVDVDDGEEKCVTDTDGKEHQISLKQSPTIFLNGVFEETDVRELAKDFLWRAGNMDRTLAGFIYDKILGFPEAQFVHRPKG